MSMSHQHRTRLLQNLRDLPPCAARRRAAPSLRRAPNNATPKTTVRLIRCFMASSPAVLFLLRRRTSFQTARLPKRWLQTIEICGARAQPLVLKPSGSAGLWSELATVCNTCARSVFGFYRFQNIDRRDANPCGHCRSGAPPARRPHPNIRRHIKVPVLKPSPHALVLHSAKPTISASRMPRPCKRVPPALRANKPLSPSAHSL